MPAGGSRFPHQLELAAQAEAAGFAALWVRDVPLNHPGYPEAIGHLDPGHGWAPWPPAPGASIS